MPDETTSGFQDISELPDDEGEVNPTHWEDRLRGFDVNDGPYEKQRLAHNQEIDYGLVPGAASYTRLNDYIR